jgi:hypothetical protein
MINRLLSAGFALILGIVLAQVFYFFTGSGSIIGLFGSVFFLIFLAICAVLGAIFGEKFTAWLMDEISYWRFW